MRLLSPYWIARENFGLFADVDRFFEDFTARSTERHSEVSETDEHFLLSVDLPGIKKEDVKIELNDRVLTVTGRREGHTPWEYRRGFSLPSTVDAEKIEVQYENGVLELYLPKIAAAKPRQISVQSEKSGFFEKLIGAKKNQILKDKSGHKRCC